MKIRLLFFASTVLLAVWIVNIYHLGMASPVGRDSSMGSAPTGVFLDKSVYGIHQLIVRGTPYQRGFEMGRLTERLLYAQERMMTEMFAGAFPNTIFREGALLFMRRWFWGIDGYYEPSFLDEMYGVSKWGDADFEYLGDSLTRQIAYHGIHDVGQFMIDRGTDFGCTVFLVPQKEGWVVGRNFDFSMGRIFDDEKILKWGFPDMGYRYVSVVWSGMVGVVTGVNEHGVYVSINAAGSTDFSRHGTPTTLVVLKALMESKNADEAIAIFRNAQVFITDIFTIVDASGAAYRIEKSPKYMAVTEITQATVITNHLQDAHWAQDTFNVARQKENTTLTREKRGKVLLAAMEKSHGHVLNNMAANLRDKRAPDGAVLPLGNRAAIDGLLAAHSVIYDSTRAQLYVNEGPGATGKYLGYDLKKSFELQMPQSVAPIAADAGLSREDFMLHYDRQERIKSARRLLKMSQCDAARKLLQGAWEHDDYYHALGDAQKCLGEVVSAKASWKKALTLRPAYASERQALELKLK